MTYADIWRECHKMPAVPMKIEPEQEREFVWVSLLQDVGFSVYESDTAHHLEGIDTGIFRRDIAIGETAFTFFTIEGSLVPVAVSERPAHYPAEYLLWFPHGRMKFLTHVAAYVAPMLDDDVKWDMETKP